MPFSSELLALSVVSDRKRHCFMIRRFLFPNYDNTSPYYSLFLLLARIVFGILFLTHGVQKLMAFGHLSTTFPDPLGIGSQTSLILAIFAEFICSAAFILGLFYRLALIPMIFTMGMAVFKIHAADPFAVKELALVYLLIFIIMYITGPGKYAVDHFISERKVAVAPIL